MTREIVQIVKIGGKVLEREDLLNPVVEAFLALNGHHLLVHGGGKGADEWSRRLGIEPRMHEGRRITGPGDLDVAVMVYAGLSNKTLVSRLQARGCQAMGLSGADGNAILAHRRPVRDIDYGLVGDIDAVNVPFFSHLFAGGITPVCCAITHDGRGQLLNTNADTIASRLAIALASEYEVHLRLCFEKPGVLLDPADESSVIGRMNRADYERYRQEGRITAGMLPKLDNAFAALEQGVARIVICGPQSLAEDGGTHLEP